MRLRWLPLVALVGALGTSCPKGLKLPALPKLDLATLPLPRDKDGDVVLLQVGRSKLTVRPQLRDALSVVGSCADLVTHCYAPPGTSLDACVDAAPVCSNPRPWEELDDCCPKGCAAAYDKARKAGLAEFDAFTKTFFDAPDCFPGVADALAGH